ncbi:hypothetical protein TSAR_010992 [Trichomalopsis sarcophagae]|uniref:Uncharacterized protein n=1 Tax=Trichomalopsis sarcophagae TaxID=543379 RepID=A0A232EFK0_9HYME|nr:hypothetical protein TSAR_010992 [Trichomalopsis sarcophagae]
MSDSESETQEQSSVKQTCEQQKFTHPATDNIEDENENLQDRRMLLKNIDNGKRILHQVLPKNKRMLNALSNIDNSKKMLVPLNDQNENIDNVKYVKVNRALQPEHHNGCLLIHHS